MRRLKITHPEVNLDSLRRELKSSQERRRVIRVMTLIRLLEGKRVDETTQFLGVNRTRASSWIKLVNKEGLAGLNDKPGKGAKSRLTKKQRVVLKNDLLRSPKDFCFSSNLWTGKILKEHIRRKFNVNYKLSTMYVLFCELGFTLQRPTRKYLGFKPEKQKEFKRELKKNHHSILLAEDEAALVSIPTITRSWAKKGIQPVVKTQNSKRQRISLFGAVNLLSGKVSFALTERGNIATFLSFLRKLLKKYPQKDIYLILDNVGFHRANKIHKEFLRRVSRLHFLFLPAYSPNFNPQEWVWKQMRREVTHDTFYDDFNDEINLAKQFLNQYILPTNNLLCSIIK